MRAAIRKELMKRFAHEFERRVPYFPRLRDVAADRAIWSCEIAPELTLFVMLQPFNKKDHFVVEIAWSDDGEFPYDELPIHEKGVDERRGRGRSRLARLWSSAKTVPAWEVVAGQTDEEFWARIDASERGEDVPLSPPDPPVEEVLPRVAPLVEDAVEKFVQYGLPLFRRVVEHQGLNWPGDHTGAS